jgi:hypothetical protein
MMDIYFIKSTVTVVLYPKGGSAEQFIVLDQLHIANGMNFLTALDHLIGAMRVDIFD